MDPDHSVSFTQFQYEVDEQMDEDYDFFLRHHDGTEQNELTPLDHSSEEEDEEETEEERYRDNVDGVDVGGHPETTSHQVLRDNHLSNINSHILQEVVNVNDLRAEGECSSQGTYIGDSKGGAENVDLNIDGLICPICYEAWSSGGGDHHLCCLPCGHMYGMSCIKKWLLRPGSSKCPRCRKKCGVKRIRLLYASRVVALDGELQKTLESLEAECASLKRKNADWSKKEAELKKREADLSEKMQYLKEIDASGLYERLSEMQQKLQDIEARVQDTDARLDPMYEMVRQMYELHIGQGHSELPMYEMVRQMHEVHVGHGHSQPLPPR